MTFKVKDLMISVGFDQGSTCTHQTWTGACVDSLLDHANQARHGLSELKDQLRRVMARA